MNDIQIRPYEHTDKDFIYASWLESYRHSSVITKRIRDSEYYVGQQKMIDNILARKHTHISVAADVNDLSFIHGYIVAEATATPTVHFCFVKKKLRKAGIAKTLFTFAGMPDSLVCFTHWTDPMESLVNRKDVRLVYDPYKI